MEGHGRTMRRLSIIIISLVAPFVFFSSLSNTDTKREKQIELFFDEQLSEQSFIIQDVKETLKRLEEGGYALSFNSFDPQRINTYIMSNPDALYITLKRIKSTQYQLEEFDCRSVKVAVTSLESEIHSITGKDFDGLLEHSHEREDDIIKKVQAGENSIGGISF